MWSFARHRHLGDIEFDPKTPPFDGKHCHPVKLKECIQTLVSHYCAITWNYQYLITLQAHSGNFIRPNQSQQLECLPNCIGLEVSSLPCEHNLCQEGDALKGRRASKVRGASGEPDPALGVSLGSNSRKRRRNRSARTLMRATNFALPEVHSSVANSMPALATKACSCGCHRSLWSLLCSTLDLPIRHSPKRESAAMVRNVSCAIRNRMPMTVLRFPNAVSAASRGRINMIWTCGMRTMLPAWASSNFHAALRWQVRRSRSGKSCRVHGRVTCTSFRLRVRSPRWYRTADDRARPAVDQCCACAHARGRRTNASDLVHEI